MTITRINPNYWEGFGHAGSQGWGEQAGTFVTGLDAANASSMAFRRDCPDTGKLSMVIDGTVFVNEGRYPVVHSMAAVSNTIPNLVDELKVLNGCMGSVYITTAYTLNGVTVPARWYNFVFMPHRIGLNRGDSANFGNLLLASMTGGNEVYMVRLSTGSIQNVRTL